MYCAPSTTTASLSSTSFTLSLTSFTWSLTSFTWSLTPVTWSLTPFTCSSTSFNLSPTSATLSSMPATLLSTLSTFSAIPWTLSSTALATFRTCAAAIRAPSCVSLSSLFSASSISVLPTSFFRYFSENGSVNGNTFVKQKLTCLSLSDLFSCNSKDVQYLHHYFGDYIHHFLVKCRFGVDLQSLEKSLYVLKDLKKSVLVRANIFGCLRTVRITIDRTKVLRRIRTERRTPIPTKIGFAGGNTCKIRMRMQISDTLISR